MNYRKGFAKKNSCHQVRFGTPSNFVTFSPPVDQLLCSDLHKNGHTTYNEHFTAYNIMTLVRAGWLHEVQWDLQWVLCTAFWSMDMTGVYACQFEAVCDVTTVPSHQPKPGDCVLKHIWPIFIFLISKLNTTQRKNRGEAMGRVMIFW